MEALHHINPVFSNAQSTNIFSDISTLAAKHQSLNLAQGFSEIDGPQYMRDTAATYFKQDGHHQYGPPKGHADLLYAIAETNRHYYNLETDPATQLLVTTSATLGLHCALWAILDPTAYQEVIVFEPFYNFYDPLIRTVGGVPKYIPISAPNWEFNIQILEEAITPKTRAIMLNSPMNPNGKVFSKDELTIIAHIAQKHDLFVICDEVYEFLTNPEHPHIPLATLPGMQERVIRISSPGKTFSFTGWRVGYLSAPAPLISALTQAQTLTAFCVPTPLQMAIAQGLRDKELIANIGPALKEKADTLANGLERAGLTPLPYQGGFFLCADFTELAENIGFTGSSLDMTHYLTEKCGVTPMPLNAFYNGGHSEHDTLLRFCVAKRPETLEQAMQKLRELST